MLILNYFHLFGKRKTTEHIIVCAYSSKSVLFSNSHVSNDLYLFIYLSLRVLYTIIVIADLLSISNFVRYGYDENEVWAFSKLRSTNYIAVINLGDFFWNVQAKANSLCIKLLSSVEEAK